MYEDNVVRWRAAREYLVEVMKEAEPDEMEQIVNCYVAVQEKVIYWEEACQPD